MSTSTTLTERGAIGIVVHFTKSYTLHESTTMGSTARNVSYGSEAVLTPEIIEANRDRNGDCQLLRLLDDPDSGVHRGPWPIDLATGQSLPRIEPGSPQWDEQRAAALRAASLLPDPDEQRIAAAKVRAQYGVESGACSRTLAEYGTTR